MSVDIYNKNYDQTHITFTTNLIIRTSPHFLMPNIIELGDLLSKHHNIRATWHMCWIRNSPATLASNKFEKASSLMAVILHAGLADEERRVSVLAGEGLRAMYQCVRPA